MISDISNRAVGQTSGQWVKPKKIRLGLPRKFFSVTVAPLWPASGNGPPIAAGAVTPFTPPIAHSITSSPTSRLAVKAVTMTSVRLAATRSILLTSEAGGETRRDHLEEHGGAVVEPERKCREQDDRQQRSTAPQQGRPQPTPGRGDFGMKGGHGLGHGLDLGPAANVS